LLILARHFRVCLLALQLMPKGAAFAAANKEKVHYFHTLEDNYGALVGAGLTRRYRIVLHCMHQS
jgi:hypothetical protein